jgi:hypothetical protein
MHQRAVAEASIETGRFTAVNAAHVVGSEPAVRYPAASAAHQTELPPEPSLGFSIDEMPGLESSMATPVSSSSIEATGDPADAPSSDDGSPATPSGGLMSERAGSSLSYETESEVGDPAAPGGRANKQARPS